MSHVLSSLGPVRGPDGQETTLVCQFAHRTSSQGDLWFGGDILAFTVPLVSLQLIVVFVLSSSVWFLMKPFRQGLISAQIIAGIIISHSFFGQVGGSLFSEKLFSSRAKWMLETSANMGLMFYMFILGVQIDLKLLRKLNKNAVVIGASGFLLPLIAGLTSVIVAFQIKGLHASVMQSLPIVASMNAISSFPVITSVLSDLNILNSDIGRIATLASLVSDICNYILSFVLGTVAMCVATKKLAALLPVLSVVVFFFVILLVLCPMIILSARQAAKNGQQLKQTEFLLIVLMVMVCGLGAQLIGQPAELGTFVLGVLIPDNIGSAFLGKMDIITSGLLVPAKFMIIGMKINILDVKMASGAVIEMVILISYTVKFATVFLLGRRYNIPARNAVCLGLIMCCRGVIEATLSSTLEEDGVINAEAYTLILLSMLIVTGIARPLIAFLYDPSAKYLGHHNNCTDLLKHHNNRADLRVLVCLHNAESVPTLIDLLTATSPSLPDQTTSVFVLNLVELKGRASSASMLEANTGRGQLTVSKSWSRHVKKAFDLFADRHRESVNVRHFTSVTPFLSMHDDICSMALEEKANIVVVPFHKQWTINGGIGTNSHSVRTVNYNVLSKSPSSVGILIDRGYISRNQRVGAHLTLFQVTLLFLGGVDDCEALAFCYRFVGKSNVWLTVIWIRGDDDERENISREDIEMLNKFRAATNGHGNVIFREERVKDAIGTTQVIRSMDERYNSSSCYSSSYSSCNGGSACDLCVVGRHHDPNSTMVQGLMEWNELPELGLIGGMLASPDFYFSVLVVQREPRQTASENKDVLRSISCMYRQPTTANYNINNDYPPHRRPASFMLR
ncbi:cation/H(+) antiporter 14-like [Andrographis paniculata]|uniref:cation/H(+) antiporter 14-like n=1 Tax=Andrographis paniculata TaxID=175694 RepID=UPI0021E8F3EE|nr:cation/H(+) antiporter 14-like [Andrographis paniculata]